MAKKLRDLLNVDLQVVQGQVHNWLDRYFPEFLTVFKSWEGKAAIHLLKLEALPHELVKYTDEELLLSLRQVVKRSIGLKKIRALKEAANRSIGIRQGTAMAKLELRALLEKYDFIQMKFEEIDHQLDQLLDHIPGVTQMLEVSGIGRDTVAGFFAEVGDLRDYQHPRQIVKLAGLSPTKNDVKDAKVIAQLVKDGRYAEPTIPRGIYA
ncbi:transposase [Peribacillus frigoritolerans]